MSQPGPALGQGHPGALGPSRFVEPVPPVQALHDTDPGAVTGDALDEDALTVESLSPCSGAGSGRGSGHAGEGDHAEPPPARQSRDSSPRRKQSDATPLNKLDVLDVTEAGGLCAPRCRGPVNGMVVDTSYSVQVQQGKTSRSAPAPSRGLQPQLSRGKSITITSTRQVLPPTSSSASGVRSERWSLGGPAELFAGTKSTWDIVLGASPRPPPQQPTAAPAASRVSTVSQSLADRLARRASCPDQPQCEEAGRDFPEDGRSRGSSMVRFVYPEREAERDGDGSVNGCVSCPSCRRDAAVQVSGPPPLQLRVLPAHGCCFRRRKHGDDEARAAAGPCAWLVQAVLCDAGLALIILALALIGAAAFHATEGPHEEGQVQELAKQQVELAVDLATDLRQVLADGDSWRATITRNVERHEAMVLRAAAAGYGEGGAGEGGARIWTFPGGLLFAVSLLTTLGFGAPVPRTPMGRMAAVLIALVGIPLNVILALQLGRLLCTRLPRALPVLTPRPRPSRPTTPRRSKPRSPRAGCLPCESCPDCEDLTSAPGRAAHWLPVLMPVLSLLLYYLLGMLVFGAVLSLPASEWLLFPLSLTAAGGVAQVPGWVRVLYAAYLEGGFLLAAVAVALLQAPATSATTDLAMKLGILDLRDYYSA